MGSITSSVGQHGHAVSIASEEKLEELEDMKKELEEGEAAGAVGVQAEAGDLGCPISAACSCFQGVSQTCKESTLFLLPQ